VAAPVQVVVDVERAGVCRARRRVFHRANGVPASGHATYPMRLGPNVRRRVRRSGPGDPAWAASGSPADTMLARPLHRCRSRPASTSARTLRDRCPGLLAWRPVVAGSSASRPARAADSFTRPPGDCRAGRQCPSAVQAAPWHPAHSPRPGRGTIAFAYAVRAGARGRKSMSGPYPASLDSSRRSRARRVAASRLPRFTLRPSSTAPPAPSLPALP